MSEPMKVYIVANVNGGVYRVFDNEQAANQTCGESRAYKVSVREVESKWTPPVPISIPGSSPGLDEKQRRPEDDA